MGLTNHDRDGTPPLAPLSVLCVLAFLLYTGTFIRIPIIPLYAESVGATTFQVGLISSSFMVMAAFASIPFGSLSDRFGRRIFITSGLLLSTLASFLLFLSKSPYEIMAAYALAGFAMAASTPPLISLVGDLSASGHMGASYGWFTAFMQMGMASGPSIGGLMAGIGGLASPFLLSGGMILAAVIFALGLPTTRESRANPKGNKGTMASLTVLLHKRKVIACWLTVLCVSFALGIFFPFFPLYAEGVGLSTFSIGLLFTVQSAFNALGRVPAGYFSDRTGRREPFIMAGLLVMPIGIISLVSTGNFYLLLPSVSIIGLAMGITTMGTSTLLAEAADPISRGVAMGGFTTFLYGGFALSAWIGGVIISAYDYWTGFFVAALTSIFGFIVFYGLMRAHGRESTPR